MTVSFIDRLIRDEAGATAIEYGLIIALISIVMITAFVSVGTASRNMMTQATNTMTNASSP